MGMMLHRHKEIKPDPVEETVNHYEPNEMIMEQQEQDERPRRGRPPKNEE